MKKIASFFLRSKQTDSSEAAATHSQQLNCAEAPSPAPPDLAPESQAEQAEDASELIGPEGRSPSVQLQPGAADQLIVDEEQKKNQKAVRFSEQIIIGDHFKDDKKAAAVEKEQQPSVQAQVVQESFNSAQNKVFTVESSGGSTARQSRGQSHNRSVKEEAILQEESKTESNNRQSARKPIVLGGFPKEAPADKSRSSGVLGQSSWGPPKRETSLSQRVKRQLNMETFKNIVQSKRRVVLSQTELEQLWVILRNYDLSHKYKDLQKPANHRRLWLKCSGALGQKLANPGYYDALKRQGFFYPNPAFIQIELDLPRTYPTVTDDQELKALMEPLRNVLYAIVIRNPTIGYCQGMNFIGARLLSCMREEEAFWTMSQILERYLPFDYYSNMIGVLVDQKVLQHFMLKRLPRLCQHLDNMQFSLDLIAFQWIACLFAINLPQNIHFVVWDLFFIKGIRVILRFALTILSLMEEEILAKERFEDIYFLIDKFCQERLDIKTLLEQFADTMSMQEIEDLRAEKRQEIMEVLKKQLEATQKNHINQYPRLKFISNFQLYHGLSKFYQHVCKRNEPKKSAQEVISSTLEQFEQDLMSIFDCDPSWPLCLYDFTHKNACPKFVTMRVMQPLNSFVIDDYWYSKDLRTEANQVKEVKVCCTTEEDQQHPDLQFDQLIIQRDYHVCQDLSKPNFVPYFKKRFQASDLSLFQNDHLFFDIDDLLDAKSKIDAFMASVTRPLNDDIFDAVERFQRRASMIALRNEVERVKRLHTHIVDEKLIIGQHMEEEFDRTLTFHQQKQQNDNQVDPTATDQSPFEEQNMPPLIQSNDSQLDFKFLRKQKLNRAETMVGQSISNLQIAVRMTLLEQAITREFSQPASSAQSDNNDNEPEAPDGEKDNPDVSKRGSNEENEVDLQAKPVEEYKVQSQDEQYGAMEFITTKARPNGDGEEAQGTESGENQSGGAETSFFEDWGAPYQHMKTLKKDEKERLKLQMDLIGGSNAMMNVSVFQDAQNDEDGASDGSVEEEEAADGRKKCLSSVGSVELESCEDSLKDQSDPEYYSGTELDGLGMVEDTEVDRTGQQLI